jgi:hypothetical protein
MTIPRKEPLGDVYTRVRQAPRLLSIVSERGRGGFPVSDTVSRTPGGRIDL